MKKDVRETCCFAGDRPQRLPFRFDEQHPEYVRLKQLLRQEITQLITREKVNHFITGMDLGIEQMCAELVLEIKNIHPQVTLECAIPYEKQAVGWTIPQHDRYYDIIVESDFETPLQGDYSKDCISRCNHYMVEKSSYVLSVWDGTACSETGQTVRYARKLGRNIIIIHPETLEIIRESNLNTAR